MTLLESHQPNFPEKPSDGFQIKKDLPDGNGYVIWTYNAQFNEWTNEVFKAALTGYVYTDQVRTRSEEIATQQDINLYIADTMTKRVSALEEKVERLLEKQ
jgi:hypothetical protein